ncbi:TonB-dependent receptor [Winogradskyella ouciana]|uniref:TonB-dependent receptor plug domain-containing protein n=1 Tax=Winogradskyella ouciana TaxID=2608631 RepID=A0A7K1GI91_9FLAO|nr:carboxypeptidase-like regulatory domain-containing protein [Winogradskyella ouciana]MTE27839.1 TonB-dependent receptor plug domain-containing protein [Winogradskyella ouciana]
MKLTRILHLIIILFFPLFISAQEKASLLDLIPEIETKFDVKFSYSANEVKPVFVERLSDTETLSAIIDRFNTTTLLNFKFLTERYITISSIDKTISVCGTIVTEVNEPLFGASVVVFNTTNGAVSSENGQFSLNEVPVNAKIVISFIGFEAKEFNAVDLWSHKECKTVQLKEQSELLNQVLITKFLTTGLQKSIDGSTVLNTEKFGTLPGLIEPDILQTIQVLPGVESVNESIANINVRGGTNDQNLMLWDGIKMYHSGHFFGLISAYNPYLTEKVVVSKNGTSSEFSDGVSSTVDMKTKNEVNDSFSGGFGANLLHADAFLEVPIGDKLAFHFSGRRSFTDVFTSPTYENYFERSFQDSEIETNSESISESNRSSDFSFYDFTAKLLFDLNDNHQFRANLIGINNDLDYSEVNTNNSNETESKTSNLKQENLGFGGSWKASWSDRFTTQLSGYYSKYNVDATDLRVETNQLLTQSNEVLETGLKFKSDFRISKTLNLLSGYQFTEVGILNETTVENPDYERTKKDVLLNHAGFLEVEFNNGKTYVRAGVRGNYFQKFSKLIVEPRLNVRQKLSNSFALKLQGEFKNQSATQIIDFQDDFLGVENRRWILANEENIPISESKQGSFGIEYNRNNFVFDVEGFYKHVDGITVSNQGFYNNFQFLNAIGSYDVKGVEAMISKTAQQFSTWLSYTYSINDYEFKTLTPSVFPNNVDIRHSVTLGFNYNVLRNLELSVGGIWRSGQPFTKPVEGNETVQDGNNTFVNYDTPNSNNLDDFMRLDTSLNYSFKLTNKVNTSIRVGVINLLDRKNSINTYYEVDPEDSNRAVKIENKSLGLTPNVSLRCSF